MEIGFARHAARQLCHLPNSKAKSEPISLNLGIVACRRQITMATIRLQFALSRIEECLTKDWS
jgi:hypothetical protein